MRPLWMRSCRQCGAFLSENQSFCGSCGIRVIILSDSPTATVHPGPVPAHVAHVEAARFQPGTLLGQRYRIVNLLGRGGMGEVYLATDLLLAQSVALKFLARSLHRDPRALNRLYSEVRLAREISHANVCRVYDLEDAD